MNKSYHSMVVPMALAPATRRASRRTGGAAATFESSTPDWIGMATHHLMPAGSVISARRR
jgi:hypothetical protein